jgi:hypothetical protein
VEWFNNLTDANKIAIVVPIGIALIGGLFGLFKWLYKKGDASKTQKTFQQKDSGNKGAVIDSKGNIANIAGRDIHTGVNEEVLIAALKALNTVLSRVDTDQSRNLVSELKSVSGEKLSIPIEVVQEKCNDEQKLHLEKEFQLYGELWKALVNLKSSMIITPSLDIMPKGKPPYDVYNERVEVAINAFNKTNQLLEHHRPFFHDDISKITKEFLGQCRGYIAKVERALSSGNFDEGLHDEADELLEIIPKAIDEIEKAIKRRIGLLEKSEIDVDVPIGPGVVLSNSQNGVNKGDLGNETWYQTNTFKLVIIPLVVAMFLGIPAWLSLYNRADHDLTASTNIFADVSKDGSILRSNNFPWEIRKSKDQDGNILFTIVDRRGDPTAISVVPDDPKYTVYESWDGMVIKFTCAEETISDFTIKVKY